MKLPDEFRPPALVARIVLGAVEADAVRLHGAIVAALQLHGTVAAERDVFHPAIAAAAEQGDECRATVLAAISRHAATGLA